MSSFHRLTISILTSVLLSTLILGVVFLILRDMKAELARDRSHDDIINKTYALNILITDLTVNPSPSSFEQLAKVQSSLETLLDGISYDNPADNSILNQIRNDYDRLKFVLGLTREPKDKSNPVLAKNRADILKSQLWMKVRQVSDDIERLRLMSRGRLEKAQAKTSILIIVLIILLILSNAVIFLFSGRKVIKSESLLRDSEKRYRALFLGARDGMAVMNMETGVVTGCNPALCDLMGRDEREIKAKLRDCVSPPLDFRIKGPYHASSDGAAVEASIYTGNGRRITVELMMSKIRMDGQNHILCIFRDITQRKQMQKELRNFASHLQDEIEKERTAISREIHDDLGQTMSAIKLDIGWMKKRVRPDQAELLNKMADIENMVIESTQTVKRICANLRPASLDHFGLIPTIEWMLENFRSRNNITYRLEENLAGHQLPAVYAITIYRVLQEALTNISRHSKAQNIRIRMTLDSGNILILIEDDGIGIGSAGPKKNSFGLIGMRERIQSLDGWFKIESEEGKGTKISAGLPL